MSAIAHRTVDTNGIRMHVAEQGSGTLVILCHGLPESWYSWRHQLAALAAAGFHAVAPDMRGYGQTDAPAEIEAYTLCHLVGDMVGLVSALGETSAVIAGHDWAHRWPGTPRYSARSVPRRDRPQRAVPAARRRAAHGRHAADRRGDLLPALLPDSGSSGGRARTRRARDDAPARI